MADNELKNIPALSYDLIKWLDKNIALPRYLQPGEDPMANAFAGGARSLIDDLVDAIYNEEHPEDVSSDDGVTFLEIGPDGQLPSILGAGRVLGPSSPSISVDIGET